MSVLKESKKIDMTQGSIAKSLVLYAIPIILSDFLQQLYNSVDTIIVGRICGKVALAAVGETSSIIIMFLGFFLGFSLGGTVVISRAFGAKDFKRMSIAIDTTLKLAGILCIVFTAAGVLLVPALLKLVGTTDDVYADAKTYLTIYLAGIASQLIYNMLSSILKAIGDSRRPLIVLVISACLNVGLDYLMVGPLNMGVAGAAYATVIAQALSCIVLWIMVCRTPEFEHPIIRKEGLDKSVVLEIFRVGLPYSLQRGIVSISNNIIISYINYFGSSTMAAWSIYSKIDLFVISCIISIGTATTTFVSQNVGARKPERIGKGVNIALLLSIVISLVYALIFYVFRYPVIHLFNSDPEVVEIAAMLFFCMIPVHTSNALPQIHAGAMRSLGFSLPSTLAMLASYVVTRQIYLRIRWTTYKNILLIVASYHLTWVICAVLSAILYYIALNCYKKQNSNKPL